MHAGRARAGRRERRCASCRTTLRTERAASSPDGLPRDSGRRSRGRRLRRHRRRRRTGWCWARSLRRDPCRRRRRTRGRRRRASSRRCRPAERVSLPWSTGRRSQALRAERAEVQPDRRRARSAVVEEGDGPRCRIPVRQRVSDVEKRGFRGAARRIARGQMTRGRRVCERGAVDDDLVLGDGGELVRLAERSGCRSRVRRRIEIRRLPEAGWARPGCCPGRRRCCPRRRSRAAPARISTRRRSARSVSGVPWKSIVARWRGATKPRAHGHARSSKPPSRALPSLSHQERPRDEKFTCPVDGGPRCSSGIRSRCHRVGHRRRPALLRADRHCRISAAAIALSRAGRRPAGARQVVVQPIYVRVPPGTCEGLEKAVQEIQALRSAGLLRPGYVVHAGLRARVSRAEGQVDKASRPRAKGTRTSRSIQAELPPSSPTPTLGAAVARRPSRRSPTIH